MCWQRADREWSDLRPQCSRSSYTLKTGIPVEEGDSFSKLLRRGSCPEIQLGVGIHSELDFFFNKKPPLLLSSVMEFTFQVRSKLLTISLRKLSTSSFILNFLECSFGLVNATFFLLIQVFSSNIYCLFNLVVLGVTLYPTGARFQGQPEVRGDSHPEPP